MNAQDLRNLAEAYTQLSTKKDDSYLETDMKKRQENNEKARKAMEKMGKMKNPHFGEEVKGQDTEMRKAAAAERKAGDKKLSPSAGKANADKMQRDIKFYDKLTKKTKPSVVGMTHEALDPVGKEDGDVNNDGKKDSTDKYLMKRRAAIGKAMGKKNIRGNDSAEQKARLEKKRGMKLDDHPQFKKEEAEVEEGYKGKHGQTDKQYADSRSQGGKMVSGDSKMSGAEYTHGRRVKAANPGMQPDVGGKTKPKSQGKMDRGTRADLEYRKANLSKKEELELSGKFTAEEIEKILEKMEYERDMDHPKTTRETKAGDPNQITTYKHPKRPSTIKDKKSPKKMYPGKYQDSGGVVLGRKVRVKEELEATELFTSEEIEKILEIMGE